MGNTAAKTTIEQEPQQARDIDPLRPTTGPRRDCGCSWNWECVCKRLDPRCPLHSSGPGLWCNCARVDCPVNPHYKSDKAIAKAQSASEARLASTPSMTFVHEAIRNSAVSSHDSFSLTPMALDEAVAAAERESASSPLPVKKNATTWRSWLKLW